MNLLQENIFLTALEPSAFNYGLRLLSFLLPKYKVYAIFSKSFLKEKKLLNHPNLKLIFDSDNLTSLGFFEVLSKYRIVRSLLKDIENLVKKEKFKFILSLDAWAFHEKIHKVFFKFQSSTKRYHFIPPKTWAWGEFRNKSLKILDELFCIFPFEERYFKNFGINAIYVGNPLLDIIFDSENLIKQKLKKDINKTRNLNIILMPGSRPQEIKNLMPFFLNITKNIFNKLKDKYSINFFMPLTPNVRNLIENYKIPNYICLSFGNSLKILKKADFGIITSGTASLEAALCGVPHIVVYKLNIFTYLLGRILVKIPYISLVNILLQKKLMKEHIQFLKEKKIEKDFIDLIDNKNIYLAHFLKIRKILKHGCFENLEKLLV